MSKKILQFDDDSMFGQMYQVKFKLEGFEHIWKEYPDNDKAEDLIKYVLGINPDLIIMDIIMPVMDGFKATNILKKDKRTKNIPLVFLTNISQTEDIKLGINLGADDYFINAESTPSQIVEKIREYLANHSKYKPNYKKYIKDFKGLSEYKVELKLRPIIYALLTSNRQMPAYFTSGYNKHHNEERSKTFGVDFKDISADDEYEMASFCFHKIPNSKIIEAKKELFNAVLMIGEDIIMGSYMLTKEKNEKIIPQMKKKIIDTRLKNFESNGYKVNEITEDKEINRYFEGCEKFGIKRAKLR